ncbi:MAG TPA: NADH-quinone oxidoreductase subunit J [Streptosporangiaceae bacterium]
MSHVLASAGSTAAATTQTVIFWLLAVISVGSAVGMVLARRAVHCALFLAAIMLSLAVYYAMQSAPFLAFVQVIVYTGAVLMLFLFVMMLIGVSSRDSLVETIRGQRLAAAIAGIALAVLLILGIGHAALGPATQSVANGGSGNVTGLATLIFTTYVFPFEVTSALLITAALGAMVLAHHERTGPKLTQRELARRRVASGRPTPLPSPGVFALHNAVDLPALLPDGSPSELSVSSMLTRRDLGDDGTPALPPVPEESGGPGPGYDNPAGRLATTTTPAGASTPEGADS